MIDVYTIQKQETDLINDSVAKLEMYYSNDEAKEFIDIVTKLNQEIGTVDYYKQQILHSALMKLGYGFYVNPYYDTKSLFNLASFLNAVWAGSVEYVIEETSFIYDSVKSPRYTTPSIEIKTGLKPLLTFAEEYAKTLFEKRQSMKRK